jgi:TonB family protein
MHCITDEIRGGTVLADTRANGEPNTMADAWKQWEGEVADGRFPLRQYLGGTDRGAVFLTEYADPKPRKAAIKIVVADAQNANAQLARWERAASLSHPHLLRILQTGRCQVGGARAVYAVEEFADEDLAHVVPVRSLTPMEAQEMLRPVLEALAYLHGKGLVHGHVKPSNIMAVGEELRVSSDGICAARETTNGRGTAMVYDAPEAGTRGASAAGDVWSVGVTLVEVLTQKLPAWEWKGQEEPELPRLPAPFGDIARQCLRRDPQRRCTLADIAARLDPDAPPLGRAQAATPKAVAAAAPAPVPAPAAAAAPQRDSDAKPMAAAPARQKAGAVEAPLRRVLRAAAIVVVLGVVGFAVIKLANRGPAAESSSDAKNVATGETSAGPEAAIPEPAADTRTPGRSDSAKEAAAPAKARPVAPPAPKPVAKKAPNGVGGGVAHQAIPDVPRSASATIHGTVRVGVRVQVDAAGKVTGADLESAGPSKYFASLAEKAAREWTFAPPSADGTPTASDWIVRFEFTSDGTKATAARATR